VKHEDVGAVPWVEQLTYRNATPSIPLVSSYFPMTGYKCEGGDDLVFVVRPNDNNKHPVMSFAHGVGSGGDRLHEYYDGVMSHVASLGFVVVAHMNGVVNSKLPYCNEAYLDQLHSLEWALETVELKAHVDAEAGTGLFGNSCGASSTLLAASQEKAQTLNVKMAIAGHPHEYFAFNVANIKPKVPVLMLTGDRDKEQNRQFAFDLQEQIKGPEKLIVELEGAAHNDMSDFPQVHQGIPMYERYIACKMLGDEESCRMVEGCDTPVPSANVITCQFVADP